MRKNFKKKILVVALLLCFALSGCTQADKVSYNVSKQADNFNVKRRLTVINTRTDKCILQMTGKISIEDVTNGIAVLVEVDRDKGIYQKHWVYLNENTMYTVEDLNGVEVSKYAYEMEFMPQMLAPIKISANEIVQDIEEVNESEGDN
jgi:uncharacterized lipoprotein YehR (DUF1307 family)